MPVGTTGQRAVDALRDQGEDALQTGAETVDVQRRRSQFHSGALDRAAQSLRAAVEVDEVEREVRREPQQPAQRFHVQRRRETGGRHDDV